MNHLAEHTKRMKKPALCIAVGLVMFVPPRMVCAAGESIVYIGTIGAAKGLYASRLDAGSGKMETPVLAAEAARPGFLALHPNGRFLYAAGDGTSAEGRRIGVVRAFTIDSTTNKLTALNVLPSRGSETCYVAVDRTGKNLLAANYTSGSVAVFPIREDGSLAESSDFIQYSGSSVNPRRQEGPHSHSINLSPDNRFALVADLGQDKLFVYRFDADKGKLTPNEPAFAKLSPGAGPRHFAFRPDARFVYSINELQSTVTVFAYDSAAGTLKEMQTISTLPKDFTGESAAAEVQVHPNGRFLYGSNRGHDSIAVFAIDPNAGTLTSVEYVPTQGKTPRNFGIDPSGDYLIVANQASNSIVPFRIDRGTGRLRATGQSFEVPAPSCVRFLPLK